MAGRRITKEDEGKKLVLAIMGEDGKRKTIAQVVASVSVTGAYVTFTTYGMALGSQVLDCAAVSDVEVLDEFPPPERLVPRGTSGRGA